MMRRSILAVVVAALSVASAHAIAQEFNIVIRNNTGVDLSFGYVLWWI